MRIAILEPDPSFGGGSEQVSLDLAKGFAKKGCQILLFHEKPGTMLRDYEAIADNCLQLELVAFSWKSLAKSVLIARKIATHLIAGHVDVFFCSDPNYLRLLALVRAFSNVPVVMHLGLPVYFPMQSKRWAYRWIDAGISPSAHTMHSWKDDGWPVRKLHVIPNWVDTDRFRPVKDRNALRASLGLPCGRMLLCYVGRLVPEKGIETLLTAFQQLCCMRSDVDLVLVGAEASGSYNKWESRALAIGVPTERIFFTGKLTNTEDYFAAADLSIVPSEWDEPFGLTAVEAMACGSPPVVTNAGILPDLVGDSREFLVVPQKNPSRLREVVNQLLQEADLRCNLQKKLRIHVAANFAFENGIVEYEKVLAGLLH